MISRGSRAPHRRQSTTLQLELNSGKQGRLMRRHPHLYYPPRRAALNARADVCCGMSERAHDFQHATDVQPAIASPASVAEGVQTPSTERPSYRAIAAKLRGEAVACRFPDMRQMFLRLAAQYDRLADHVEHSSAPTD
jgi:hypothetical protein